MSECPHAKTCSAPLCPLHPSGIFYHDEDICNLKKFQSLAWIKRQKAAKKKTGDAEKYFTVEMLQSKRRIVKGTKGIDPNQPLEEALAAEHAWIKEGESARKS